MTCALGIATIVAFITMLGDASRQFDHLDASRCFGMAVRFLRHMIRPAAQTAAVTRLSRSLHSRTLTDACSGPRVGVV